VGAVLSKIGAAADRQAILKNYIMQSSASSRRFSPLAVLGTLVVAIAVFGWGLQYKLSLYQPSGSSLSFILHAKLLSQKERPVTVHGSESDRAPSAIPQSTAMYPVFLLAVIVTGMQLGQVLRLRRIQPDLEVHQRSSSASNYFSFRPPPAYFSAN
jgi:hypothetical protein